MSEQQLGKQAEPRPRTRGTDQEMQVEHSINLGQQNNQAEPRSASKDAPPASPSLPAFNSLFQQQMEKQQSYFPNKRQCNCKNSKCLKLYCECFASGDYCRNCNCNDCHNNFQFEEVRTESIVSILERNENAFRPKFTSQVSIQNVVQPSSENRHQKGCACKRSSCLKKYCECFQAGIFCGTNCKCNDCKNYEGSLDRKMIFEDSSLQNILNSNQKPPQSPTNKPAVNYSPIHPNSAQKIQQNQFPLQRQVSDQQKGPFQSFQRHEELQVPDIGLKFTKVSVRGDFNPEELKKNSEELLQQNQHPVEPEKEENQFFEPNFQNAFGIFRPGQDFKASQQRRNSDSDEDMLGCDEDPGQIGRVEEQKPRRLEIIPKKEPAYKKVLVNGILQDTQTQVFLENKGQKIEQAQNEQEAIDLFAGLLDDITEEL